MKKAIRWITSLAILLAIAVGILTILNYPPLIRTSKWNVTADDTNEAIVYQILFDADRIYVEFPDTENPRNRWFALDFSRQASGKPNWPNRTPYLHVNEGQGIGVSLTGIKIGIPWETAWGDATSSFTGPDFAFTITKSRANKPAMDKPDPTSS